MSTHAGKTLTFIDLFKQDGLVQIPVLQRDYAQGREAESEIRQQFLASLRESLCAEDPWQPLDLDFIYGSMEQGTPPVFSVLDGQQRLTTLFLLHWYLALKCGKLEAFHATFLCHGHSRFTYKTRASAREFFDALALAKGIQVPLGHERLSDKIKDQKWFFSSWLLDPTVQGCLTMLDAMHQVFHDSPSFLYTRLINSQCPRIIFQFLNLNDFSLSDELYIKMNGRGKILSDFENFKASFSLNFKEFSCDNDFERKIDGVWTDLFWSLSNDNTKPLSHDKTEKFNSFYLRFFLLMAFYRQCELTEGSFEKLPDKNKLFLKNLRESKAYRAQKMPFSFDTYSLQRIEAVLDYCVANEHVRPLLRAVLEQNNYLTESRFYALVCLIHQLKKPTSDQFLRWQRVTDNLIHNQIIDSTEVFLSLARSLRRLATHAADLYAFLANTNETMPGFTQEQWQEEKLKCSLLPSLKWQDLLQHGDWQAEDPSPCYESHPYLMGKVGFILKMSCSEGEETPDPDLFKKNADKVCALLDKSILNSDEFLLQRALLSLADYTWRCAGDKYSFGKHNGASYRDRDENWFRVARTPLFSELVAAITGGTRQSLLDLIKHSNASGWRRLMITYPETFQYCSECVIGKEKENNGKQEIYLVKRKQYNGYNTDLRTYVIKIILDDKKKTNILPSGIANYRHHDVIGHSQSFIDITLSDSKTYRITYEGFQFVSRLKSEKREADWERFMPGAIGNFLKEFFPEEDIAA